MVNKKRPSAASSSSSEEERSRLAACRSVCVAEPLNDAVSAPAEKSKKRLKDPSQKRVRMDRSHLNTSLDENGPSDALRAKAADLLGEHLENIYDFGDVLEHCDPPLGESESDPAPPAAQQAGLTSKSAIAHLRLFVDSHPGALDRNRLGHHPPGSNVNGHSGTQKPNQVDDSSGDEDSDDEHMARIRSVVVDGPPRPPRTKKLPSKG